MKVPLLQKGNFMPPCLHFTKRTASAWTEPSHLVHAKEGTGQKIGEKPHEYCT
jgi:hypothetical protein